MRIRYPLNDNDKWYLKVMLLLVVGLIFFEWALQAFIEPLVKG